MVQAQLVGYYRNPSRHLWCLNHWEQTNVKLKQNKIFKSKKESNQKFILRNIKLLRIVEKMNCRKNQEKLFGELKTEDGER